MQIPLDFTITARNNRESQQILEDQAVRLNNNANILYNAFLRGERLSGIEIIKRYGMIEYRRRIKDIKDFISANNLKPLQEEKLPTGAKEWWLDDIATHRNFLNQKYKP